MRNIMVRKRSCLHLRAFSVLFFVFYSLALVKSSGHRLQQADKNVSSTKTPLESSIDCSAIISVEETIEGKETRWIQMKARIPLPIFMYLILQKWKIGCSANCSAVTSTCVNTLVQLRNGNQRVFKDPRRANLGLDLERNTAQCLMPFDVANPEQTPLITFFKDHQAAVLTCSASLDRGDDLSSSGLRLLHQILVGFSAWLSVMLIVVIVLLVILTRMP